MTVVDETWYKELEDPDNFYMKVTALKLLEHLTEFCAGLHTVDAVDITQLMKELYKDSDGVPQLMTSFALFNLRCAASIAFINWGTPSESL